MKILERLALAGLAAACLISVSACSASNKNAQIPDVTALVTGYAEPTYSPVPTGPYVPVDSVMEAGEIAAQSNAASLSYSIRVPRLNDSRAAGLNEKYNKMLKYYKEEYAPMLAKDSEYLAEGQKDIHTFTLYFDYDVKYNDKKTISLLFRETTQVGDLYSEFYYAETVLLDADTQLTMHDVIHSDESPYQVAAREIARQIDADRKGDNIWDFFDDVDENAVAMYLDDYSFYLDAEGNVVLFINPAFISGCTSGLCEFPLKQ